MMKNNGAIYSENFYKWQITGASLSAQVICDFINNLLPGIKSVVDFGCGTGAFLFEFSKIGKEILGLDFGKGIPNNLLIPPNSFKYLDISTSVKLSKKYDLGISLEVAEHLPETSADIFIKSLCDASDIIIFSAAIPGQGGLNHLNEQFPAYWAKKFSENGFTAFDVLRNIFWDMDSIKWWYRQNIILYISSEAKLNTTFLQQYSNWNCKAIVHPKKYIELSNNYNNIKNHK